MAWADFSCEPPSSGWQLPAAERHKLRLIAVHSREIDTIRNNLASAVPETFSDVVDLLQFAIGEIRIQEGLSADDLELAIFSNVAEALWSIRDNFAKAVRDAGYDLMLAGMGDVVNQAKTVPPLFAGMF